MIGVGFIMATIVFIQDYRATWIYLDYTDCTDLQVNRFNWSFPLMFAEGRRQFDRVSTRRRKTVTQQE